MKRTAANARSVTATCRQIVALMATARQFVPQDRGEAMIRKWLSRIDIHALGETRMVAVMADATLLAADLLLSYPAASGATAFAARLQGRGRRRGEGKVSNARCLIGEGAPEDRVRPTRPIACYPNRQTGGG